MEKITTFFKNYFDTPKIPLKYYFGDVFYWNLIIGLMCFLFGGIKIWTILFFVYSMLSVYTFFWYSDYQLFKFPYNKMKIFKYRRSVFSKDGIKNAAADSLAREQHYTIHENNISRDYTENVKTVAFVYLFLFVSRYYLVYYQVYSSVFTHTRTIKKYKEAIQQQYESFKKL
ncbi:TPA: hypothetical protein ACGOY3_001249 [Streptococcus suis]